MLGGAVSESGVVTVVVLVRSSHCRRSISKLEYRGCR